MSDGGLFVLICFALVGAILLQEILTGRLTLASGIETEGHERADGHGAEHESPAPKGDAQ